MNRLSHVYKQIAPPSNNRQSVLRFDDHKDLVKIDESWMHFKYNDGKVYRMDEVEIEEDTSVPIEDRWTIKFVTQSPNSPDLNTCDLGFFW